MSDDYLQREFEEHPSLASLDDYDASLRHSPAFEIPSQHSGFRSSKTLPSDISDLESTGPWSPPAWRRPASGWFDPADRGVGALCSPVRSRQSTPDDDEEVDMTVPANVPLPQSPQRRTPSPAPVAASSGQQERVAQDPMAAEPSQDKNNYFRFALRAEVQQRTEPVEAIVSFLRFQYRRTTSSRYSIMSFLSLVLVAITVARSLSEPQETEPGPDLIKVAGLARNFEPLIQYSEHGALQVGDLQETGVAVWDLGETVRYSNMTSSPIIVKELDVLSDTLKTLAIELTRFFANVDGDVDSILIVMEWAKRELTQVSAHIPSKAHSLYARLHAQSHHIGGARLTQLLTSVFGPPQTQRTRAALQRTFNEFLNVLEESINNELLYSNLLFGLFEAIDRQFLNLQRTVVRETDTQDAEKERADAELADLWRRATGGNKSRIDKFEKNKALLASIRGKTVRNRLTLEDHNARLLKLKAGLESLRRRLVSPLLRSNVSSTLGVADQIRGLDATYEYLRLARERQKDLMMERLYGAGRRGLASAGDGLAIEGSGNRIVAA